MRHGCREPSPDCVVVLALRASILVSTAKGLRTPLASTPRVGMKSRLHGMHCCHVCFMSIVKLNDNNEASTLDLPDRNSSRIARR
ncbi:Unknown protein sequence [Pseudomonas syringae pv. viburni]|uniref:Uncharacterized protein n=1 Tax=Pseudomonas syringae pv. viburni TaxID=251703 RepID=A0A0Q0EP80_9PSED|nr:Unknown protein sequence [Pseudomonas syringae pv. viburni]